LTQTLVLPGSTFDTTSYTKSVATTDLPANTTRITLGIRADMENVGDYINVDQLSISFGDSTVWRAGTARTTHPIWAVPEIQYADDEGSGFGDWSNLPGLLANPPVYDPLTGFATVSDQTLIPQIPRIYQARTISYGLNGDMFVSPWGLPSDPITVTSTSWKLKNIANPDDNMIIEVKNDSVNVGTVNTATVFQPLGNTRPVVLTEGYKGDKFSLTFILHHDDWLHFNSLMRKNISLFLQSDTD
jgi:hypothetical protein